VSTDTTTLRQKLVAELGMRASAPGTPVPDVDAIALLDREGTRNPALSDNEQAELALAREQHLADYEAFMVERSPTWRGWVLAERCDDGSALQAD
jgi:hypothetical protein